jgi:2-dehydro-3-deoxyphosphogluconate aldolase/(4S)-4-hydroxy-2-oxoglutarate aldolase
MAAMDEVFRDAAVIPVVRETSPEKAMDWSRQLLGAGFTVIEVACTTPQVDEVIRALLASSTAWIGAGTVLNQKWAERVWAAGAQFLVAPNFSEDVWTFSRDQNIFYLPGVWTPTEAARAASHGLGYVKLFPASSGGISHMRALREILPTMHFIPTGSIDWASARDWLDAGAWAVGMGGALRSTADLAKELSALKNHRKAG